MEKFVFFQTQKTIWLCPSRDWNRYQYENELTPTRQALVLLSQQAVAHLYEILDCDQEQFVEIVKEELDNNDLTTYSN